VSVHIFTRMPKSIGTRLSVLGGLLVLLVWCSPAVAGGKADAPRNSGKPVPIMRLVFLGDSITVGVGTSDRATHRYSAVLTELMRKD